MTTAPQPTNAGSSDSPSTRRDPLASLRIERSSQATYRKERRRWWPLFLLLLFIGSGGGYWFLLKSGVVPDWLNVSQATSNWVPAMIQNRPEVSLVSVVVQSGQSADAVVVATGYVESRQQARIGSRAAGRIETIYFEEGVEVKANDLLAVLEHANMDAALATSEASVSRAKTALAEQEIVIADALTTMNRAETLWKQRSIAEAERDQAKFAYQSSVARKNSLTADYELAVARRREAEQVLENMFIRAPFAGTVISKDAELGESILPGGMGEASGRGSVATIADLAHLEVECDVKEDFITRIVNGQKAEISVDAVPSRKYHGVVRKIIPMGDRARATIKVKVEINDADRFLFPEMSGTVYFLPQESDQANALDKARVFCPSSAIAKGDEGDAFVWFVDKEGRAKKNVVKIVKERDGKTEIASGLSGGERVVATPGNWREGQLVKVVE